MEELRAQLKFKAIIIQCCTVKVMSLVQALCDIVCSKDGSLHGEPLGPSDPQRVAVITTNPDMLFASDHPSPRFGPRVVELCLNSVYREKTGKDLIIEQYGKPHEANFRFVEEYLTSLATKRAIKISNFYMIGDNPESDIAGGNGVGWITILVKSGVFKPTNHTSIDGNDKKNPATHVVENFKEAIELIFRLENL